MTFVTKLHLGCRLPHGLEAFGAGVLSSTSAKGYWCCWWLVGLRNTTQNSWVYAFACSSKRTCGRRKDWRCAASSSCRRSKEFLEPRDNGHYSSERPSSSKLAKQASTTSASHWTWHAISFCFPCSRCSKQLEANDSSSSHVLARKQHKTWKTRWSSSIVANHSTCPPAWRHKRRLVNARSLEEVQKRGGWKSFASA